MSARLPLLPILRRGLERADTHARPCCVLAWALDPRQKSWVATPTPHSGRTPCAPLPAFSGWAVSSSSVGEGGRASGSTCLSRCLPPVGEHADLSVSVLNHPATGTHPPIPREGSRSSDVTLQRLSVVQQMSSEDMFTTWVRSSRCAGSRDQGMRGLRSEE